MSATTIRRAGLVAGLTLLIAFSAAMPASAFVPSDRRSANALSHEPGAEPIKVGVSTASSPPAPTPAPTPAPIPAPTPAPTPASALSAWATRALNAAFVQAGHALGAPGVQASIVFTNGATWQGAYGWADLGSRRMTSADVFDIASVTKTFIAAAVLKLVAEHRLSLDDRLSRWLPALPNAQTITIRELLSHTSGLADYFSSNNHRLDKLIDAKPLRDWSAPALLAYVGRPRFAPGQGWAYSNTNYLALGLIVEGIEGRPLATVLRDRFLLPLGLGHTALQSDGSPAPASQLGPIALPYAPKGGWVSLADGTGFLPYRSLATALYAAGGLVSNATDLAHWAAQLYGGQVLPPDYLAAMLDARVTRPFHPFFDYGLGVMHLDLGGQAAVGHSGAVSGYRSSMFYVPALHAAIVVLSNTYGPNPDQVTAQLIATLTTLNSQGTLLAAQVTRPFRPFSNDDRRRMPKPPPARSSRR